MISTLLELIGLKEKLPEPIGYSIYGPIWFPMPNEISINNDIDDFVIISFKLDNLSDKELDNIRILYKGKYTYIPRFRFERRDIDVIYTTDIEKKELIISAIPPKESLTIEFFIKENENFEIEEVLIGKIRINRYMQIYTQMKKNPFSSIVNIAVFLSLLFAGYAMYIVKKSIDENNKIASVVNQYEKKYNLADNKYCVKFFDNNIENEKLLSRKYSQLSTDEQNEVLKLNNTDSYEKLKAKDEVYLLEKCSN